MVRQCICEDCHDYAACLVTPRPAKRRPIPACDHLVCKKNLAVSLDILASRSGGPALYMYVVVTYAQDGIRFPLRYCSDGFSLQVRYGHPYLVICWQAHMASFLTLACYPLGTAEISETLSKSIVPGS